MGSTGHPLCLPSHPLAAPVLPGSRLCQPDLWPIPCCLQRLVSAPWDLGDRPQPLFQGMYIFLHTVKGTPFETPDQGKARLLTHWEQMDYGVQFTASRKFLTITPIVL